jgi:translocator protein
MKKREIRELVLAVLFVEVAGIIGSLFTAPAIKGWYATLPKPSFNPPNWIFAPVWTTLFALMGIALFLVWRKRNKVHKWTAALVVFFVQLFLNIIWSVIFFGLHRPGVAFVELIILWLFILATIIIFAKISRPAAWLLVPYILWVSFAAVLNFSLWQLASAKPAQTARGPVCSQEAKICPDGTAVVRTGQDCEFSACQEEPACGEGDDCPIEDIATSSLWQTATDTSAGIFFQYPSRLMAKYIIAVRNQWPPRITIIPGKFSCLVATSTGEKAELRTVGNGHVYCVRSFTSNTTEAIYTNYSYITPNSGKLLTVGFALRYLNCDDYVDPEQGDCLAEREALNLDSIVDRVAGSVAAIKH